jgi:hypothetical protein
MLTEAEAKVARLQAQAGQADTSGRRLVVHPQQALKFVNDMRRTIAWDPARARAVLQQAIEPVRLRPQGDQLLAVVRGSVTGILRLVTRDVSESMVPGDGIEPPTRGSSGLRSTI